MKLRKVVERKNTKMKADECRPRFDIIGDIAIIEITDDLKGKEKETAKAIVSLHPHIKTVCKKTGKRSGEFRLRGLSCILGRNTETIHKEHGCQYKLDVKKAYFSPREATERQRTTSQVKPGERIMVMFSGVGPYAIAIARKHPDTQVYAVEKNPDAHMYAEENVKMNRVRAVVTLLLGDARKRCLTFHGKCNRVVMPLPKGAHEFLDVAIKCLKPSGGIIHFYHWAPEENLFGEAVKIVKEAAKKEGKNVSILEKRKVLSYGPRTWKVCIDAKVWK